jgi:hypothetical protein
VIILWAIVNGGLAQKTEKKRFGHNKLIVIYGGGKKSVKPGKGVKGTVARDFRPSVFSSINPIYVPD